MHGYFFGWVVQSKRMIQPICGQRWIGLVKLGCSKVKNTNDSYTPSQSQETTSCTQLCIYLDSGMYVLKRTGDDSRGSGI